MIKQCMGRAWLLLKARAQRGNVFCAAASRNSLSAYFQEYEATRHQPFSPASFSCHHFRCDHDPWSSRHGECSSADHLALPTCSTRRILVGGDDEKSENLARRESGRQAVRIGAIIGLHWLCLFGAVKIANVSIALAGLATLSLFTAFTEPLLTRRRIKPFEVFLGLIVLAGIYLIRAWNPGTRSWASDQHAKAQKTLGTSITHYECNRDYLG
jgi:hypothetical protein